LFPEKALEMEMLKKVEENWRKAVENQIGYGYFYFDEK